MLLALWPSFMVQRGRLIDADPTHRAIRGKEVMPRTLAMIAAEEHLARLQGEQHGTGDGLDSTSVVVGSVPISVIQHGVIADGVLGHGTQRRGAVPGALGTSVTASNVASLELAKAIEAAERRQAEDDDDEMAMLAITLLRLM